ncbi:MAG TPA: hypothetical protein VKR21_16635 [Solirubrobacteraceae bacterium]|nr:hypothetical protein [Solirubrobacteraceae bacterium]
MRWLLTGVLVALLCGCGLGVQAPDLFLLTRTGQGQRLTLLVNDGGTIRCDGGRARQLADPLLLQARDLASSLGGDAQEKLRIPSPTNSVYRYTIRLEQGTISFPDTAAASGNYPRLAQAEQFALKAAQQACGLSG